MRRPGLATIGSIGLHAAVAALALFPWPRTAPPVTVSSVPVSIISSEQIAAAAADNPSEDLIEEADLAAEEVDAETPEAEPTPPQPAPPQPRPPEPAPPEPAQTRRPDPAPSRRPEPAPPEKARPTPPARPSQNRPDPGLDLDSLAQPSARQQPQRPTGQSGAGQAPRATGPQTEMFGRQVTPHWIVACELQGMEDVNVDVRVTIDADGRVTAGPTLVNSRPGNTWRVAADSVLRAIRAAAPFDTPPGYTTREVAFRFETATMCGNR